MKRGLTRRDVVGCVLAVALGAAIGLLAPVPQLVDPVPQPVDVVATTTPVEHRFGLADESPKYTAAAYASFPEAFSVVGGREDNRRRNIRLTDALLNVYPEWQNVPQPVGDCVAASLCHAVQIRAAIKGKKLDPFRPFQYGLARVTIGKNRPGCNSDGAVSSWAIDGFLQRGYLESSEANGLVYNAKTARDWGCKGPPAWALDKAKGRTGDAHPIRSLDELIDGLANGFPATYAGLFGTDESTIRVIDGRWVAEWNDRWPHQMLIVGWDGSGGPGHEYVQILNSWGGQWPQGKSPMNGEIPGSIWVKAQTGERMIREGEVWAVSDVRGFAVDPDVIDWSVFDITERERVQRASDVRVSKNREVPDVRFVLAP